MINEETKGIPWKEILHIFYQVPPGIETQPLKNEDEFIELWSRSLGFPVLNTGMAIYYLEKQRLIKIIKTIVKKGTKYKIELEPKGFEVASNNEKNKAELEMQKNQEKINTLLMKATVIMASASLIAILFSLFNLTSTPSNIALNELLRLVTRLGFIFLIGILVLITGLILINLMSELFKKKLAG